MKNREKTNWCIEIRAGRAVAGTVHTQPQEPINNGDKAINSLL